MLRPPHIEAETRLLRLSVFDALDMPQMDNGLVGTFEFQSGSRLMDVFEDVFEDVFLCLSGHIRNQLELSLI